MRIKQFIFFILLSLSSWTFSESLINVNEDTLSNGLKILTVEDSSSPLVVCRLFYKVGSVNEQHGITGLSHMLEHMLFKGTKSIGIDQNFKLEEQYLNTIDSLMEISDNYLLAKDTINLKKYKTEAFAILAKHRKHFIQNELWGMYQSAGASSLNAYTSDLVTAYIATLPSNKLELYMWLESDRMSNAVMRAFYTERDVVVEERRMRYEDSPRGRYYETLGGIINEAHTFRIPTIGYMSDIVTMKREVLYNHYKTHYVPNNAVLVLVGDFKRANALKLANKYFGQIPIGKLPIKEIITRDPVQVGQKRLLVEKDAAPCLDIYFKTPGLGDKDIYSIDILEGSLNGESGRLYQKLVKEKGLVSSISAGNYIQKYQSYFRIHAELLKSSNHQEVEDLIFAEIKKIQKESITKRELEKVKNNVKRYFVDGLRENESLASRLGHYEIYGSWRFLNTFYEDVQKVMVEDVSNVVKKYFAKKNSIVGWIVWTKDGEK